MVESLFHSLVNPKCRLTDTDYIPHLMYAKPFTDGYWDIPLAPNAKCFPAFEPFDLHIPNECTLPVEFERFKIFHKKHGNKIDEIWSNDAPESVKTFKSHSFIGATFYQYSFFSSRRNIIAFKMTLSS